LASMGSPSSLGEECAALGPSVASRAGFNGVAEFTRRRANSIQLRIMETKLLQWGRRVHSAKSAAGFLGMRPAERLQWGRRVHSAKSPLASGPRVVDDCFNGVAEFTRRRAVDPSHGFVEVHGFNGV